MEQQQFKVSFSLGTKLLLSIVLLLVIVIGFLNISTIFMVTDDKRAYVYQSQSTEAVLAGREFANMVRHSVDTLRLSLAAVDPRQPPSPKQTTALKEVIDNQSDLLFCSVSLVNLVSGGPIAHSNAFRDQALKDDQLSPADFALSAEMVGPVLEDLKKKSYALVNLTKTGGVPVLGILLADLRLKDNPTGVPVGLGVVSLREYAGGRKGLNLAVATSTGRILYDAAISELYGH